jgi:hypothetical protein
VPAPDRRTIGELLADSDALARETLLDATPEIAPAMIRSWNQQMPYPGKVAGNLAQVTVARSVPGPMPGANAASDRLPDKLQAFHRVRLRPQRPTRSGPDHVRQRRLGRRDV